jgi:aromatic-L-amino-acid/L-tryptophan decarboxylase
MKQPTPHGDGRPTAEGSGLDWDSRAWKDVGARFVELAAAASTGWENRRASPKDRKEATQAFRGGLPEDGIGIEDLEKILSDDLIAQGAYNGHPRWFAYITSSPLPIGVMGEFLAAALNQNTALQRIASAAQAVELQTIDWIKEILGLPNEAEGIFTSGGQMANIVAHAVARDYKAPWDTRRDGVAGPSAKATRLRIYASSEVHHCHLQAAELLGLGREAVRIVPVDAECRMETSVLRRMIVEDRGRGDLPITIVGTAGTVGTGAIDPLGELLRAAREEDAWFHVDGAYGAFARLASDVPADLQAMSDADSVACDPHKWLYSPIDAGVVLIRQPGLLEQSFAFQASYLQMASDERRIDLVERSPENTRPFRALKVWLALLAYGRRGFAAEIERNLELAAYMEQLVRETPDLVLAAPRDLSIVCWRVEPPGITGTVLDALQDAVIAELEKRRIAMLSQAHLPGGGVALRACIVNFRTQREDIEAVVEASREVGLELASGIAAASA